KMDFVHKRADDLKPSSARTSCGARCGRGGWPAVGKRACVSETLSFISNRDDQPVVSQSKALIDAPVGALAVFGGVDAGFYQRGLVLVSGFLVKVGGARDLLGGARGNQLRFVFDRDYQLEFARHRSGRSGRPFDLFVQQVELYIVRKQPLLASYG